jgi:hypothetical protein
MSQQNILYKQLITALHDAIDASKKIPGTNNRDLNRLKTYIETMDMLPAKIYDRTLHWLAPFGPRIMKEEKSLFTDEDVHKNQFLHELGIDHMAAASHEQKHNILCKLKKICEILCVIWKNRKPESASDATMNFMRFAEASIM